MITPIGAESADEEIGMFLNSRTTPKERKTIEPIVLEKNRIKPINAMDERLMQKRVQEVLLAVERKLKHFHLFTEDTSYHTSVKYRAIRSWITSRTQKESENDYSFQQR